jgi:hypothetical protein
MTKIQMMNAKEIFLFHSESKLDKINERNVNSQNLKSISLVILSITKGSRSLRKEYRVYYLEAPEPQSATDVRGLFGVLMMLRRFEPRIAEFTVPLNRLTSAD